MSAPVDDLNCESGSWKVPVRVKKKTVEIKDSSLLLLNGHSVTDVEANKLPTVTQDDPSLGDPVLSGPPLGEVSSEQKKKEKRALCISLATLVLSIPALIGAWCWPALIIPLVGGTVTLAARSLGHSISFALTLAMILGLLGYLHYKAIFRRGSTWNKYGPFILMLIAAPLIMADPIRHIFQDTNIWPSPGSSEYRSGCHDEAIHCLTVLGVFFTIVFTYLGFALMIVGTMWNANLCAKLRQIRDEYYRIREESS